MFNRPSRDVGLETVAKNGESQVFELLTDCAGCGDVSDGFVGSLLEL